MQMDGEDRRRYPRSRRGVNVALEDSGPGVLNHVDNISANGVLCHTIKPVPLMTRLKIQLEVTLDDRYRIDAEGIIVRCERDEQGDASKYSAFHPKISPVIISVPN